MVWRELRRAKETPEGILSDAFSAADSGQWSEFIRIMGGTQARRTEQPVKLAKAWNEQNGKYGDPLGWQIFGVEGDNQVLPTHLHIWKIDFVPKSEKPLKAKKQTDDSAWLMETTAEKVTTRVPTQAAAFADGVSTHRSSKGKGASKFTDGFDSLEFCQ